MVQRIVHDHSGMVQSVAQHHFEMFQRIVHDHSGMVQRVAQSFMDMIPKQAQTYR